MHLSTSRILVLVVFAFISLQSRSEEIWKDISFGAGMINASYQELNSNLVGENVELPSSGSISSINGFFNYKFLPNLTRSFYVSGTFPLITGTTGSYFGGSAGVEYYFGKKMGSRMSLTDSISTLQMKPRSYFFWGGEVGLAYLIYLTETAKRSDMALTLGPMVGGVYKFSENWVVRYQAAYERGIGVATTTGIMKFSLGLVKTIPD